MVYSIGDLKEVIGLSKWTVYEQIKKGEFPRPVQLSANRVGWRDSDVLRTPISARPCGIPNDDLRLQIIISRNALALLLL